MFCSKCGHTLPMGAEACPHCALPIGQSSFIHSTYTSAQSAIEPDEDAARDVLSNYTRTTYTSAPDLSDRGEADTRTTYRPAYTQDDSARNLKRDLESGNFGRSYLDDPDRVEPSSQEGLDSIEAVNDELRMEALDLTRFRSRPIESTGQSGISEDVSELIHEIDTDAARRSNRRAARAGGESGGAAIPITDGLDPMAEAGETPYDNMDDFDSDARPRFGAKQLIKVLAGVIVAVLVVFGGVKWFNYIRSNHSSSPIENVRQTLYTEGIQLIKTHASSEYEQGIISAYSEAGNDLATLSMSLAASGREVNALLPADPTENEQTFLSALNQIEKNIENCITSDAMAASSGNQEALDGADARWTVVNNSILQLENASSAAELTAIINGQTVDVVTARATATPAPAVNYNTLSKGDKNDEVAQLQRRLIALGYLDDTADGAFGSKTQTAVKVFQQSAGLPVTGVADNVTLNALYADDAPTALGAALTTGTDDETSGQSDADDLYEDSDDAVETY